MRTKDNSPVLPENISSSGTYSVTSQKSRDCQFVQQSEKTVYESHGPPVDVVAHVHPATALSQSVPMAAGQNSQIAPLTASIDEVLDRLETVAERIEAHLKSDVRKFHDVVQAYGDEYGTDRQFEVAARSAALNLLLKATLYEWYTHQGDLPILNKDPRNAFDGAVDLTANHAFHDSQLNRFIEQLPCDVVAELSWWRHGILTSGDPADDLGYLFENLIPASERGTHG